MLTTEQCISIYCPTLASSSKEADFIALASNSVDEGFFGKHYNEAVALMACHLFTLFSDDSKAAGSGEAYAMNSGSISHMKEGDLTLNFSAPASTDAIAGAGSASLVNAELASTRYGVRFIALRKSCQPFFGVCGDKTHC